MSSALNLRRVGTPRQRGFTIVEALVAVVLTGIGVVAALNGLSALAKSQALTTEKERMSRLAVAKYDELASTSELTNIGGTFEDQGEDRYVWEASTANTDTEYLTELTVTVSLIDSYNRTSSQSVSGLVYEEPQSSTSTGTGTTGATGATGAAGTAGGN